MSRCRQGQCLVRTPSCLADGGLLAVSHAAERVRISKLSDLFGKDINSPNPNYLPKAPLPNAKSQGGSGFNIGTRAGGGTIQSMPFVSFSRAKHIPSIPAAHQPRFIPAATLKSNV